MPSKHSPLNAPFAGPRVIRIDHGPPRAHGHATNGGSTWRTISPPRAPHPPTPGSPSNLSPPSPSQTSSQPPYNHLTGSGPPVLNFPFSGAFEPLSVPSDWPHTHATETTAEVSAPPPRYGPIHLPHTAPSYGTCTNPGSPRGPRPAASSGTSGGTGRIKASRPRATTLTSP